MAKRRRKRRTKGYVERSGLYGVVDSWGRVHFYGAGGGKRKKRKAKRRRRRSSYD